MLFFNIFDQVFADNNRAGGENMAKDVMCRVENCKYWSQGQRCSADAIEVSVERGGKQAGNVQETNCHTFKLH